MGAYYTFLPYLRQGMADSISTVDSQTSALHERAEVELNIELYATAVSGSTALVSPTVAQHVKIKGPGDITGINSNAILKTYPSDWTTNFEPNYLPYIEFYDEDFLWRYTPAKARKDTSKDNQFRLRPWLSLIVLKEGEFINNQFSGILPSISITSAANGAFPDPAQMWAWAHVHVNGDWGDPSRVSTAIPIDLNVIPSSIASGISTFASRLTANPDIAVSRLLCPRRLEPNTGYHAFLIPTFEVGRRTGLGIPITSASDDPLAPSWQLNNFQKDFPVYHQWFFKTGGGGDYDGPGPYTVPYTITYLENRHQNDALNLSYCLTPYTPQFFTTLNPPLDLLPRYILQSPTGQPAVKTFYHNVATMSTIGSQRELAVLQEQGALHRIYFTGGYTLGVGLHEECWISANHAARRAIGHPVSAALETYGTTQPDHEKPNDYAPRYLRHALRAR